MERAEKDAASAISPRTRHRESLLGVLGGRDVPRLDDEAFRDAVDRAWDEAAREVCALTDTILKA